LLIKNRVSGKWNDFLTDKTNKQELFGFLHKKISNIPFKSKFV